MRWQALSMMVAATLSGACASFGQPPVALGLTEAEVLAAMGPLTGRHALDGNATRLEFATGPFGRVTWMVDLGADGRSRAVRQVLSSEHFAEFQPRAPGMTAAQVVAELGRPGERMGVLMGVVWSWRWPTNDCLVWQVTIGHDGKAIDAGYGLDWMCEVKDRHSLFGRP